MTDVLPAIDQRPVRRTALDPACTCTPQASWTLDNGNLVVTSAYDSRCPDHGLKARRS